MNPIKLPKKLTGLLDLKMVENKVTTEWHKKAKVLENLTNENKSSLENLKLQLLKGMTYKEKEATTLFEELKKSQNITPEQKEFAKYLYDNYAKHSIRAMGFD